MNRQLTGLTVLVPAVLAVGLVGCPGGDPSLSEEAPPKVAVDPQVDESGTAVATPSRDSAPVAVPPPESAEPIGGRVIDRRDGRPVAGATVEVRRHLGKIGTGRLKVRGTTDEDGRFRLLLSSSVTRDDDLYLRVSGAGLPTHVQNHEVDELRVDTRVVPLVGKVLDSEGRGIQGARLAVWPAERHASLGEVLGSSRSKPVVAEGVSGAEGSFEIGSLAPGWYVVEASKPGNGSGLVSRSAVVHGAGTAELSLVMVPAASLLGMIDLEGDDGAAAQGLVVRVGGRWAVCDQSGRFEFTGLPPGLLLTVEITRPGASAILQSMSVALDAGERREIKISLTPPRPDSRRRIVIDMRGQSVPEGPTEGFLSVALEKPDESPVASREVRLRRQGAREPVTVRSSAEGHIVHPSASRSRWDVWLQPASSLGVGLLLARLIEPASVQEPVRVEVPHLCDVVGKVVGRGGTSVAGARVSIGFHLPGRRGATLARSDSRGQFLVEDIPAGRIFVRLAAKGPADAGDFSVSPGQRHQHSLKVDTRPRSLMGTVAGMGDVARPRTGVRLEAVESSTGRLLAVGFSGDDGRFVLDLGELGKEDLELVAVLAGWRRQSRPVKSDHQGPLQLYVGLPSSLAISCRDQDGQPRALPMKVRISYREESDPHRRVMPAGVPSVFEPGEPVWYSAEQVFDEVADASGKVRIPEVRPGIASVHIVVPGAVPQTFADVEFADGEPVSLTMNLQPASSLALEVLGENGRPLTGAEVTISGPDGDSWTRRVGADGLVVVDALPAGDFQVEVRALGHFPWSEKLVLAQGQAVTRRVVVKEAFGVDGTVVTDGAGVPVVEASCTLIIPGKPRNTASGPDGRFSFDLVPTGTWRLRVEASGYQTAEVRVGRPAPGAPHRVAVEVKLKPQG